MITITNSIIVTNLIIVIVEAVIEIIELTAFTIIIIMYYYLFVIDMEPVVKLSTINRVVIIDFLNVIQSLIHFLVLIPSFNLNLIHQENLLYQFLPILF